MGSKSDYLENKMLDSVLGGPAYSLPATVYVALYTANPDDTGGGTEVTGNAYARVAVTNNSTNWPAASGGSKSNGTDIVFPTPSPSGWGVVTGFAIYDAASAGNELYWSALTASKTINAGDLVHFPAASLVITED